MLQLKVGGDISEALAALKQFSSEIDRAGGVTTATAAKMSSALNNVLNSTKNLGSNADFSAIKVGLQDIVKQTEKTFPTFQQLNSLFHGIFARDFGHGNGMKELSNINDQVKSGTLSLGQFIQTLNLSEADIDKLSAKLQNLGLLKISPQVQVQTNFDKAAVNISNIDVSGQLEAARQKINEQIERNVNEALGVTVTPQINVVPSVRSIQQLETEMDQLRQKIAEATSVQDIQKLSVQFGALQQEANKLKAVFVDFSKIKITGTFSGGLVQQVQAFGGGIRTLQNPLTATQNALNAASSANQKFRSATGASTQTLINFGRILQDAPFGLIGIANNINPVVEGFRSLSLEAKAVGTSVGTQLLTALKGAGGLALGFSAITAAIQFAVIGVDMWTRGFGKASEKSDAYKQKIDELKKSFEALKATTVSDIIGSAGSEFSKAVTAIESLRENINLAKKGFIDKKEVVAQYNQELGDTIGKVKTLDEVEQVLAKKADAYIQFTLLKAAAQQALGKASEAALKAAEEQSNIKQTTSLAGFLDPKIVGQNAFQKFVGQLKTATKENEKNINQAEKQKDRFIDIFKEFQDRAAEIAKNNNFKFSPEIKIDEPKGEKQKFGFLFDFLPFDPSGKLKPEQRNQLLDAADKFSKEFTGIFKGLDFATKAKSEDQKIKFALQFDADLKAGKVQFDLTKIREATDKALKPEELIPEDKLEVLSTQVADQFIKGFQNASEKVKNANPLNISPSFNLSTDLQTQVELFKTNLKRIGAEIPKAIEATDIFGNPIVVTFDQLFDTSKISNADAIEALRKFLAGLKDKAQQETAAFKAAMASIISEGFSTIGEAIGAALTGNSIGNVFKQFEQFLGSAVEGLGKQIIALNVAALAVKKSLKLTFANPAVGIAAGIGLVAIGSALKSLAGGGIKGFADGGLVYGPTLGLIGEGRGTTRNNPEVIAPLDKLQNILQGSALGGGQVFIPNVKISGSDLVLVFNRASNSQYRNFGRR